MNDESTFPNVPRAGAPGYLPGDNGPAPLFPNAPQAVPGSKPTLVALPSRGRPAAYLAGREAAAADALRLALEEGHVFAALTGPAGVGKTAVLDAVLAGAPGVRALRIKDPDTVSDKLAAQIEQVALAEASKPDSDRHVAIVVDDAHLAAVELLDALSRLAAVRRAGGRLPQVILVGEPVLWDRLKAERFRPLERRLAIRHELSAAPAEDAWASVEQALDTPAPPRPRASDATRPAARPAAAPAAGAGVPPSPDGPDRPEARIDDLLARRAELVASPDKRRRSPVLLFVALLIVAAATTLLAAAVQMGVRLPGLQPASRPVEAAAPPAATPPPPDTAPTPRAEVPAPAAAPAAATAPATTPAGPGIAPALEIPAEPPPGATYPTAPAPSPADPAPQPAAQPAPVMEALARPSAPGAPAVTPPIPLPPEVAALMIRRGEERLALGDFTSARSFFERSALGGNARAAFLAVRTYDRAFLPPNAAGLADPRLALDWYQRAAAAGDPGAATRLQQLGQASR